MRGRGREGRPATATTAIRAVRAAAAPRAGAPAATGRRAPGTTRRSARPSPPGSPSMWARAGRQPLQPRPVPAARSAGWSSGDAHRCATLPSRATRRGRNGGLVAWIQPPALSEIGDRRLVVSPRQREPVPAQLIAELVCAQTKSGASSSAISAFAPASPGEAPSSVCRERERGRRRARTVALRCGEAVWTPRALPSLPHAAGPRAPHPRPCRR
jgi:hypothetical protein